MKKTILPLFAVSLIAMAALSGCSTTKANESGGAYTASIREEFTIPEGMDDTDLFDLGQSYCRNNVRDAKSTKQMIVSAYNMRENTNADYSKFESITQDKLCLPGNVTPAEPLKTEE